MTAFVTESDYSGRVNDSVSPGVLTAVFLGWGRPWTHLFAEWLGREPDRLRRRLVVVPTLESGRRLRECLVSRVAREGTGAVLGPRMATPNDFFRPEAPMPDAVQWAGWVQVLRDTEDGSVAALFPAGVSSKDDGWRLGVARQIEQAREMLASGNSEFAAVAAALPQEANRWSELAELERQVVCLWRDWGYTDPVSAKRERARKPELAQGVDEVILAGVADPTGLSVEAWRRLADRGVRFTVLVGAPGALRDTFDEWGQPKPGFWADREKSPTPAPARACLAADAVGLAEAIVRACEGKENSEVAVGVCDASFAPALSRRFLEAGWGTFDPQGVALAKDGWPELLEGMAAAIDSPNDHAAIARVARHPEVWRRHLKGAGARAAFAALDEWEVDHGATDAGTVLAELCESRREDQKAAGGLLKAARSLVAADRRKESEQLETRLLEWLRDADPQVARQATAEMESWSRLPGAGFALPLRLRWLAASLASGSRSPDSPSAALALQGWLELPYDPAPHLVLAAMHEGKVPESPAGSPLITESVREQLGLRDRKSRLAREVFLYTAMVEGRRARGSVTVVNAQTDPRGEPCKPSRVLLHAAPANLPSRVLDFVKESPDVPLQPTPPWSRGDWKLRLPADAKRNRDWRHHHLSPSTLRVYLACPTRFYLSEVLGWEAVEPFKGELNGRRFGDLVHAVLRQWGDDPEARELADAATLRACWLSLLKQEVTARFGVSPPPLLRLQVMSAEERLAALAEHQARQRVHGWRVLEVEREFNGLLKLAGIPVHMRVDRIDRHQDGRVRVIDYKTGRTTEEPRKAHLRAWSVDRCPAPLGPLLPGTGRTANKSYGWADLQLPLYVRAVREAMDLAAYPEAYYVLMPEAVGETGFVPFEPLDAMIIDNAMQWAEEAAQRIVAGLFWPPAPEVKYDNFAALAPEGLEKTLADEWKEVLSATQQNGGGNVP